MERKKVLVTGASGFIGSNLSELLKKSHYEVVTTDLAGNVDIKADIRHLESENLNLNEFYSVVHLAAKISVPESFENPELYQKSMSMRQRNYSNNVSRPRFLEYSLRYSSIWRSRGRHYGGWVGKPPNVPLCGN